MKVIHLCGAEWGYLFSLPNLKQNLPEAGAISPYGDFVQCDGDDTRINVGSKHIFGWQVPDAKPEELYGYMSEGTRDGRPLKNCYVEGSLFYPERLFVWGSDENGKDIPTDEVRKLLEPVLRRSDPGFWLPMRVWRGFNGGWPTFYSALRAHTDIGETWYGAHSKLTGARLPDGYTWEPSYHGRSGDLYIETPQ